MEKIEIKDKLVSINRITKVVKGGRRFAFSALVVAGDYAGSIGVGHAKAKQVPDAIKKGTQTAKNNMQKESANRKIIGLLINNFRLDLTILSE